MASQLLGIKTRFTNDLGSPLVGGQVYTYFAGTSTNQDTYSDAALTVPNTNPVVLDDTGSADIFLKGSYRIRVFDKSGRFIEEQDNVTQAASQGDATELSNKVTTLESGLSAANTEIDKVKLDTGITATAKFGGVDRKLSDKLSDTISVKDFGAVGNGTDETAKIQAAIDYAHSISGGYVLIPKGQYYVRNLEVKDSVHLKGLGDRVSKLRFFASDDTQKDAESFVIRWTGRFSTISDLSIDGVKGGGKYNYCSGIEVSDPNPSGSILHRKMENCLVSGFAGYNAGAVKGGSLGVNAEYTASDIVENDTAKLTGGHGIYIHDFDGGTELHIDSVKINSCDGVGLYLGSIADSKFGNLFIAACTQMGIHLARRNMNIQLYNIKVSGCRRLNPRGGPDPLYPWTGTVMDTRGAVTLTGSRIQVTNLEVQESGSNGIALGWADWELSNSNIHCVVDGNGGYVTGGSDNTAYRRHGIYAGNFNNIVLNMVASDFQTTDDTGRQMSGLYVRNDYRKTTSNSRIRLGSYYRIAKNDGADFKDLQYGQANKSNEVGHIFEARLPVGQEPNATFGSGYLEAVNSGMNVLATISNQTEQTEGISLGYNINGDRMFSSRYVINGNLITIPAITQPLIVKNNTITASRDFHKIDTGGAATAALNTIKGGYPGQLLRLTSFDSSRVVSISNSATTNIHVNEDEGSTFVFNTTKAVLTLMYDASFNRWVEVSRSR